MRAPAFGFLLVFTAVLSGCSRQPQQDEKIIARVGTVRLTLEDARHSIDTSQGSFENQLPGYISLWVTNTLLFQEAQREGIDNTDRFRDQLEETRRQIAIQDLLQQNIYADTSGLDTPVLKAYFDQHANEFFVREDMVRLNSVCFNSREIAADFASIISQEHSFADAVTRARNSNSMAPDMVAVVSNQYFSQRSLYPPELWKVASTLKAGEVSFPVKTGLGYFVIQVISSIPQGKTAEFDLVRDEVKNRVIIEHRRHSYDEYLGTLRKRYDVEILVNAAKLQDSTQLQHHE